MAESKIVIIGAGAAGIAAACRLIEKGFKNLIILEAKNRIGGRIHTIDFADNVVDLGAQWVHGENIIFDIANPHNLLDSDHDFNYSSNLFADAQGKIIPTDESAQAMAIYYKISEWDECDLKEWNGSYGEFFKEKFYKEFQKSHFTSNKRAEEFFEWIEKYDNHMQCSDSLFEVSAKRVREYKTCDGNPVMNWKNRGFKTILDLLMKSYSSEELKLPVVNKILFNKEVSNINYTSNDKVVVSSRDGSKFEASHVIFTPSLGVLKHEYKTLFTPSLSEVKERAIEGFSFGAVNKFFLEYPYRWWPKGTTGLSFLWSDEDKREFLSTWGQGMSWLFDIFIFFVVENHKSLLCGWSFGKTARLTENLSDTEIFNGLQILLETFYGKTYNVPKAVSFTRSKWFTDRHIRGGYSFRSMKTEQMDVKSEELSDPITTDSYKPIILFAGEATHERFFSTVHGAIESGFREADRLMDYFRILKSHL